MQLFSAMCHQARRRIAGIKAMSLQSPLTITWAERQLVYSYSGPVRESPTYSHALENSWYKSVNLQQRVFVYRCFTANQQPELDRAKSKRLRIKGDMRKHTYGSQPYLELSSSQQSTREPRGAHKFPPPLRPQQGAILGGGRACWQHKPLQLRSKPRNTINSICTALPTEPSHFRFLLRHEIREDVFIRRSEACFDTFGVS